MSGKSKQCMYVLQFCLASLFVVKSGKKGKKLSPKVPGPLDLTKKSVCTNLSQSYHADGEAISTGFFLGSVKCAE